VWSLLPQAQRIGQAMPDTVAAAQASYALEGFLQRNYRLPCADTNGNGRENCPATAGGLPWRDLGLGAGEAVLKYAVNSASLATAGSAYTPHLPLQPLGYSAPVLPGGLSYYPTLLVNGLDFCHKLRTAAAAGSGLRVAGLPVAYMVVHPGANSVFDGDNVTGFALPETPSSPTYDDLVDGVGLSELSGSLACPQRMGEANAAALAAYASYDLDRNAQEFLDFRNFAVTVRQANKKYADAAYDESAANMAIAAAAVASSVALAVNSMGITAGLVAGSLTILGVATANLVTAGDKQASSERALTFSTQQAASALIYRGAVGQDRLAAYRSAVAADIKGLRP